MSILFGKRLADGRLVTEQEILDLAKATARYAMDGTTSLIQLCVGMGLQPYHSHTRARLQLGPYVDRYGNMITLDGRLDNYEELCDQLSIGSDRTADEIIMLAAFERWQEGCFSRFVGEWAVAIWNEERQALYLARDHAGTRTLYFEERYGEVCWSTYLETFFVTAVPHTLDSDYAVRYLSGQPIHELTPYKGIRGVHPAHYIVIDRFGTIQRRYWNAVRENIICYQSDGEYEEHFLTLFRQAVGRRFDSASDSVVYLSGGMDSTSIVCVADEIARNRCSGNPKLLDTLSYFDPSEPHWDEKPFISAVEAYRRKRGRHLELSISSRTFTLPPELCRTQRMPGPDSAALAWERRVVDIMQPTGVRVFITGHGGDEVLGGVPTPLPELADLLISTQLRCWLRQSIRWCLADRSTLVSTSAATLHYLSDLCSKKAPKYGKIPDWVNATKENSAEGLKREDPRYRFLGGVLPSQVGNARTWLAMLEHLPHLQPGVIARYEYRYPYLDRDLVEFLFSIPREQLVRPGRRRSLMRRALTGIVPEKILERKRKAYCSRGPMVALARAIAAKRESGLPSMAVDLHLVDPGRLDLAFEDVVRGGGVDHIGALMRVLSFDSWMSGQIESGQVLLPT